jgi:hypothetical protein
MRTFVITRRTGQTFEVLVDDEDYERVIAAGPWAIRDGHGTHYATRAANGTTQALHRLLTDAPRGQDVDHIDGNGLNNQRSNLRVCTRSENLCNRGKNANNNSGFKGVSWDKRDLKWRAFIGIAGKRKNLGVHATPELAHAAYCEAAERLHGAFARTE